MVYVAEVIVKQSQLVALGGMDCAVALYAALPIHIGDPKGPYYLSVQPDGSLETRSVVGAWETSTRADDVVVYDHSGVLSRGFKVVNL